MTSIEKIAALSNRLGCQPRIKLKHDDAPEAWGNKGISFPVSGFIELQGPWSYREIEWIEIDPTVMKHIGRLTTPKQLNHLEIIVSLLQVEDVGYEVIDGIVRIPFSAVYNP